MPAQSSVVVLTYHSISSEPGPTSIPVEVFSRQMAGLAESGYRSMTLQDFLDWRSGREAPGGQALITFDDGFADFHRDAAPILAEHGFSALVFLPTALMGGHEAWKGANDPARRLMAWDQVKALAAAGVEFGAHGTTHADLTMLSPEARRAEIEDSGEELAQRLGKPTRSFAAPYGHVDRAVLADLASTYEVAFGVRMDRPRRDDPREDVPRIDMHYFRDSRRWREFLRRDDLYFNARRALRAVKAASSGLLPAGGRP